MLLRRLCLCLLIVSAAPLAAFGQTTGNFELVKVAEDVFVVDTTLTPGTAQEELAALRKLTDKQSSASSSSATRACAATSSTATSAARASPRLTRTRPRSSSRGN
jgi:hypothetical protein